MMIPYYQMPESLKKAFQKRMDMWYKLAKAQAQGIYRSYR